MRSGYFRGIQKGNHAHSGPVWQGGRCSERVGTRRLGPRAHDDDDDDDDGCADIRLCWGSYDGMGRWASG